MNEERLWAPWRMEFIRDGAKDGECFLCKAGVGGDDRALQVARRGRLCFCVLNRFPYNNGHLLIAPYRHEARLEGLTAGERAEILDLTIQAKLTLDAVCAPHGFNVGLNLGQAAGAGLESHLHMHIVPRWSGDTNFVTTVGSVKVIPQALEEMWRLLSEAWREAP